MVTISVHCPVSGHGVNVPFLIRGQRTKHPVTPHGAVRRSAVDGYLLQVTRVAGHDPAVGRTVVAVGGLTDVDITVRQPQSAPLALSGLIKRGARRRGPNGNGAAGPPPPS